MDIEVLGQAKTVRMRTVDPNGRMVEAPMEIMLAALVQTLSAEDKARFFSLVEKLLEAHNGRFGPLARVVQEINMPHIRS